MKGRIPNCLRHKDPKVTVTCHCQWMHRSRNPPMHNLAESYCSFPRTGITCGKSIYIHRTQILENTDDHRQVCRWFTRSLQVNMVENDIIPFYWLFHSDSNHHKTVSPCLSGKMLSHFSFGGTLYRDLTGTPHCIQNISVSQLRTPDSPDPCVCRSLNCAWTNLPVL